MLHAREDLGYSDYSRINSLLDYSRAINDWPRRNSSATRLFEAAETWHRQIEQVQLMADAGRMVGQSLVGADGKTLPFPEPPCPEWRSGDNRIVPLRTAEEVLAEGAHMHNCVASYIPKVLAGTAALYHGEVAGKPLTIQIAPTISGYRVVEAKTLDNAEPTAAQMRVLREFIAHFCGGVIAGEATCECKRHPSLNKQTALRPHDRDDCLLAGGGSEEHRVCVRVRSIQERVACFGQVRQRERRGSGCAYEQVGRPGCQLRA